MRKLALTADAGPLGFGDAFERGCGCLALALQVMQGMCCIVARLVPSLMLHGLS